MMDSSEEINSGKFGHSIKIMRVNSFFEGEDNEIRSVAHQLRQSSIKELEVVEELTKELGKHINFGESECFAFLFFSLSAGTCKFSERRLVKTKT